MAATVTQTPNLGWKVWARGLGGTLAVFALIFVSAGTLYYWQGWVYLALTVAVLVVTIFALRDKPELIQERLSPKQGMKNWDKVYFALSAPLYFGTVLLAAMDVGRFGWSSALPLWDYLASIALFLLGQAVFLWAKMVNAFFSSVVRIQTERGQTVCQAGPYRYVRHPGYVGSLVWTLATPLILGSVWALIPAVLADALLIWRTAKEDETLQRELSGYTAYTEQVKYRLAPGVW